MNRKKKVKQTLLKKAKKANAKKNPATSKPRYISKAERAKMEAEEAASQVETSPEQAVTKDSAQSE